ncbi:AAA family ATPase [Nonomuraea sp. NPDC026600]|uniref:AAA family ATPase n=1 Tax=Nonomuraea sp. NPDC026600 TaxID=3155363 RepID=UPI0033EB57A1
MAIVPLAGLAQRIEHDSLFVIDGLVSSAGTLVYGQPKAGKSVIITQLAHALANGEPFLGAPINKPHSVAVALSDAGAWPEFISRYTTLDPTFRNVISLTEPRGYDLERSLEKAEILIVDNLDGLLPPDADLNNRHTVKPTLERLTKLVQYGMPVVLVHHASKPGLGKGKTPIGSQFITSWPRHILYLEINGQGAGTHRLTARGNHVPDTVYRLTLEDGDGLRFTVAQAGEVRQAEDKRKRDKATMDMRLKHAQWLMENCQGLSRNETAKRLAAEFDGSENTYKRYLTKGTIPVVQSDGRWQLTEAADQQTR